MKHLTQGIDLALKAVLHRVPKSDSSDEIALSLLMLSDFSRNALTLTSSINSAFFEFKLVVIPRREKISSKIRPTKTNFLFKTSY